MAYIILNNWGGHTGRFKKKCLHLFYVMLKQTHFSHWQELEDTQRSGVFSSTEYVIFIFFFHWRSICNRQLLPVSHLVCIKKKIPTLSDVGAVILFLNLTFHFWTKSRITQTELLDHWTRPCGNDAILPAVANYHKGRQNWWLGTCIVQTTG